MKMVLSLSNAYLVLLALLFVCGISYAIFMFGVDLSKTIQFLLTAIFY